MPDFDDFFNNPDSRKEEYITTIRVKCPGNITNSGNRNDVTVLKI